MRVLVTGDRNWTDRNAVWAVLDGLYFQATVGHLTVELSEFVVIEGQCPYGGADKHAEEWAKNSPTHSYNERPDDPRFEHLPFPADWETFGKAAGPIRNKRMLYEGKPDVVWAFHDDLYKSRGTSDMIARAKKADVPVYLVSRL